MKKCLFTNIILSLELSVLFVSAIFLSEIISYKNDLLSFAYILFTSLLYGIAMISKDKKAVLTKWGLSIPFSYIIIQYFWTTNYSVKALNWIFPAYGKPSAGGSFAGFVLLLLLSVICLICGIASASVKIKDYVFFEKIQLIITSAFTLITAAIVLFLEQQFPSYMYVI